MLKNIGDLSSVMIEFDLMDRFALKNTQFFQTHKNWLYRISHEIPKVSITCSMFLDFWAIYLKINHEKTVWKLENTLTSNLTIKPYVSKLTKAAREISGEKEIP